MSEAIPVTPALLRSMPIPDPGEASDKERRGQVLVVGSSALVPGASLLSGLAALRSGAGKVTLAVPRSVAVPTGIQFPEAGILALPETDGGEPGLGGRDALVERVRRSDAVLIGPGLIDDAACAALIEPVLHQSQARFVLDAAAVKCVLSMRSAIGAQEHKTVLTPHAGEMAALLDIEREAVEADPERIAREAASRLDCIVALKGATTYVADPSGQAWRNERGVVGLGTSGSGDVLSGLIAGLLARGAEPVSATLWGVHVHALAGEALSARIGRLGFLAREIVEEIPRTLQQLGEAKD
jgi:ADP-dependent NAD(P)H-hydrate dehydratase